MNKTKKQVGFWIKFLNRILDLILIFTIIILSVVFDLQTNTQGNLEFKHRWFFYIWCIEMIFLFFLFFILIPYFSKGKTVFYFLFRIRMIQENNQRITFKNLCKKELFFTFFWILIIFLFMILFGEKLFVKYVNSFNVKKKNSFLWKDHWEWLKISIVTTLGSIMILLQIIIAISVIVSKQKLGFHEKFAQLKIVYDYIFISSKKNESKTKIVILPQKVHNEPIIWLSKEIKY